MHTIFKALQSFERDSSYALAGVRAIIVGGEAIRAWGNFDQAFDTHDYDIRLILPIANYSIDWKLSPDDDELLRLATIELAVMMVDALNFEATTAHTTTKYRIEESTKHRSMRKIFAQNDDRALVDIFPITNDVDLNSWQMAPYRTDSSITFDYPVPYIRYNGVFYAGLGFVLWDLINLVHDDSITKKKDRNSKKLQALLSILDNPSKINSAMLEIAMNVFHVSLMPKSNIDVAGMVHSALQSAPTKNITSNNSSLMIIIVIVAVFTIVIMIIRTGRH